MNSSPSETGPKSQSPRLIPSSCRPVPLHVSDLAEAHLKARGNEQEVFDPQILTDTMAMYIAARMRRDSGEELLVLKAETEETDWILGTKSGSKKATFLDTAKQILGLERQLG